MLSTSTAYKEKIRDEPLYLYLRGYCEADIIAIRAYKAIEIEYHKSTKQIDTGPTVSFFKEELSRTRAKNLSNLGKATKRCILAAKLDKGEEKLCS